MWNYKSEIEQSTGYEDVFCEIKKYTSNEFKNSTEEQKEKMIEELFNIYRSKNIFPITYYNEQGISNEIKKCIEKDISWDGSILDFKANQGSSLCKFMFPNLQHVQFGGDQRTMYRKFYDDHLLKRSIKLSLSIKKSCAPSELRSAMELVGGGVATNFKVMNAKALYEKYAPSNGVIYDFCGGFGGRMLGCLSSKNNYTYIATEPCTETFDGLVRLGLEIQKTTNRVSSFEIFKSGSENKFTDKKEFVDFAFSSPPYFSLEKYSDEDTQCYIQFPTIEEWFDGYVKPTISNIYDYLKPGCYYAVNIADFKVGNKEVKYVDRWIDISEQVGFKYIKNIPMKLSVRKGVGHDSNEKKEGIFLFTKEG